MRYSLKALGRQGIVQLQVEAEDTEHARRQAENQGLRVVSIRGQGVALRVLALRRAPVFDLVLFSQELGTLLSAGLPLIDALESLAEKAPNASSRKVLEALVRQLYEGRSLSQALGEQPRVFPALYVALVQSSERTGALGDALGRYISYRQRLDVVRQKLVGASVYPLLLLLVGGGVVLFLLGYVVPRFSLVFEGMGNELPWLSQVLMKIGLFLHAQQLPLALAALGGLCLLALMRRNPALRRWASRQLRRWPALHQRLVMYELARFYRSLGILLQGGIPILTAMCMARGLLGSTSAQGLEQASRRVGEGLPLSDALELGQLVTPVSLRLLRAGEQSGNLGEMLERCADFHDQEIGRWVEWFVRLFEPLLMTFIGLLIGLIVILMYMPIFELASSIH
ncbi:MULTISPECIES: type II secretion system F family protein [Pseudomonas]|uniref:Type II secretion system F family protein n=1 Tax=Pseudomonas guariconensis TaxID=1288410 RepID=A0AAX0VWL3_9PSED|nr:MULTISPECIES: type II secretion system F family protein [Pseudomonas]MBH3360592.1 type II secretion system F family protein [Pseudomonas guariconensis]PLV18639.1 type II secretion system F family protein [Pseudomonas guariconensis]PLV23401.1 type II secretion system F family protein [Pseudomonas guariconensis]PLV28424.1 type II secretion system F family protein [Pseudomonas guariconensis]TYO77038.1 type II secretion system F family protein [Pseudomonas sp. CK-NBRI-02]